MQGVCVPVMDTVPSKKRFEGDECYEVPSGPKSCDQHEKHY